MTSKTSSCRVLIFIIFISLVKLPVSYSQIDISQLEALQRLQQDQGLTEAESQNLKDETPKDSIDNEYESDIFQSLTVRLDWKFGNSSRKSS